MPHRRDIGMERRAAEIVERRGGASLLALTRHGIPVSTLPLKGHVRSYQKGAPRLVHRVKAIFDLELEIYLKCDI